MIRWHKLLVFVAVVALAISRPAVGDPSTLPDSGGNASATQSATRPEHPLDPPAGLTATDSPEDNGQNILLTWSWMDYDGPAVVYQVMMAESEDGPFYLQGSVPSGHKPDTDRHAFELSGFTRPDPKKPGKQLKKLDVGRTYYFKLVVLKDKLPAGESAMIAGRSEASWVTWSKLNAFVAMVLLSGTILFFVWYARRNPGRIFIRRINGLEAVDDAMGRAAEMGKPIYFCHGLAAVDQVITISSLNMLGKIAEQTAEYGTDMKVTCFDVLVMQVSQEMVKQASIRVGRPDSYREDDVFFVSGDQFAYATAVEGMLLRDKPATVFFFGQFQAESLLLSETGAETKAIQIAGTDTWGQIPFFITTCDYTLIGEEMYAASAYLSREPRLLGTVKGQDVVKAVVMGLIVVGTAVASLGLTQLLELAKWLFMTN